MILDATASDFEFGQIEAYNTQNLETVIDTMTNQGTANTLVLSDAAWNDDFSFTLSGPSSGTFDLSIVCESDKPTKSPSRSPSPDPTLSPTIDPTAIPTNDPSR